MIDRRALLASGGLIAAAPAAGAFAHQSKPSAAADDRLIARAVETRRRLDFDGARFSGAAYEWLVSQGRSAQFFLLGEEHGIAENPRLAAQLFGDLVPAGYSRVAIEISPPMAFEIDRALQRGGADGVRALFADEGARVAFFGMREEVEWLAAARRSVPGNTPMLWGADYEVAADRKLIARLVDKRKPAAAQRALEALAAASGASWAEYARTRDLTRTLGFAGDPALVRAVREAWPRRDAETDWILETLEETQEINRLWVSRQGLASNQRRAALLRRNFLRHWHAERRAGRSPRVMLKFGSSHMVRGLTGVQTFDLGTLVPEIAAIEGRTSFNLLVVPGRGSQTAVLDPTTFRYAPAAPKDGYLEGLQGLANAVWQDAFTLFDTHLLRPLASSRSTDPELMRAIHGFDAILVMSGSHPSANL